MKAEDVTTDERALYFAESRQHRVSRPERATKYSCSCRSNRRR